jgi:dihydroorotate dehydrogenase
MLRIAVTAVVVTVDQQASYYERSAQDRNLGGRGAGRGRGGAAAPPAAAAAGPARYRLQPGRLWYTWQYLDEVRRMLKVPLLVKGILTAEDAVMCVEHGVDGIIVSNHGGRQLDGAVTPLRVLPGIAAEAGGMTVMMDSGVRRGTDVLKALALGAQFVFIGRPFLYAAAVAGEPGVRHAFKLLQDEIDRDMALLGIKALTEMRRDLLTTARGSEFLEEPSPPARGGVSRDA